MDKEEALSEFLKGLRIIFNNASAYPKEHPYFVKSVDEFKKKVDALFVFLNPIKIDATPQSLFIDGRHWEKLPLYVDLASMFHLRKIKSVEFKDGLTIKELVDFLSAVALPIREILKEGGVKNILNKNKAGQISIQELDYSELLKSGGEEVKDIWAYLFKDAVEKQDLQQINELADNFEKIIGKFKVKYLLEDEQLRQNTYNFLSFLKTKEKDKFYNCTKGLLKAILKDKSVPQGVALDKLKVFFKDLSKDDLVQTLLDEISNNENFNYLTFAVFSRLFEEDVHKEIAGSLGDKIKSTQSLKANPKVRKKIKELFSISEAPSIATLYRQAFHWLSEDNPAEDSFAFSHHLMQANYLFLLLNLLNEEKDKGVLSLISECLLAESDKIIEENNLEYLRLLLEVLDKRVKGDPALSSLFEGLTKRIVNFIENLAFGEKDLGGLGYLVDILKESSLGFNFYLDEIFNKGNFNPWVLKLLLKFFSQELPYVYEKLREKHSDIDFMVKMVGDLGRIDSPLSLEILKYIFSYFNNIIKREVLKAMPGISGHEEFLLSILKNEDAAIKSESLAVLAGNEQALEQALEELFNLHSVPLGSKNKIRIENIIIIEKLSLRQAEPYLLGFSKRRFFWNNNLRKMAQGVLGKWHGR